MNKLLLIVELLSYFINLFTRTSRQQELSSREKQNTADSITRFGNKFGAPAQRDSSSSAAEFGAPSVPVNTGTTEDTAGLQQASTSDGRSDKNASLRDRPQ